MGSIFKYFFPVLMLSLNILKASNSTKGTDANYTNFVSFSINDSVSKLKYTGHI